jgi:CheY-like chemotaxis protein
MEDSNNRIFDLAMLIEHNDFDVRGVSESNGSLTAGQYFTMLFEFIDDAAAISQYSFILANEEDFAEYYIDLKAFSETFSSIGLHGLSPETANLLKACEAGVYEDIPPLAHKFMAGLEAICQRARTSITVTKANEGNSGGEPLYIHLSHLSYTESNRKPRILCVDDNTFTLKTLAAILRDTYEVFSLSNGALVDKFLRSTTPEMFLLDYNMPEINGFELVPIIRSFPEHKDTPIIFLTAAGTMEHIKTAVSLGSCDYVVKPVNNEILMRKIAKHIKKK